MEKPEKRGRGGERREEILAVAMRLFTQYGLASVTTRQIAEAVGISQPSLYAHFRSADEIGEELCLRGFEALNARFEQAMAQHSAPAEQLDALGRAYIEFGLEHPDIYRIAFMVEGDTQQCAPPKDDAGMVAGKRAFDALHGVVAAMRGIDDEETATLAQSIWACVHGLVSLLLARPHFPWVARDKLIAQHLDSISGMLKAQLDAPRS